MSSRSSCSFGSGVIAGLAIASYLSSSPSHHRTITSHDNGHHHAPRRKPNKSIRPLPSAGDLFATGALAAALSQRASATREIIFMLTDEHHERLALNLLLNLEELKLHHHLVIAKSAEVCAALWARAERLGLSLGCGWSSFLHRGTSSALDAGLDAYAIEDSHVYHLWWQRWFFLSEAVGLGYKVLSLDTDVSLRADPYPLLHGALSHRDLITGIDTDQALRPFFFPAANVGFVYARGPPGGGCHWVLSEARRRLERLLRGEIVPLPKKRGVSQQVVWDQDTFKDVLETSAFTVSAPSYRHAQGHCMGRGEEYMRGASIARFAPPLPDGWAMRVERLQFFPGNTSRPPLPSTWLPLHLPPPDHGESAGGGGVAGGEATASAFASPSSDSSSAGGGSADVLRVHSIVYNTAGSLAAKASSCNGSSAGHGGKGDGRWDPWSHGSSGIRMDRAIPSGSYAAVPMWLFATYHICPHGDVCDGRWGWRGPPPVLIGHLVGVKAKFWILRMLGWWHYDAARPPPAYERDRRRRSHNNKNRRAATTASSSPPPPPPTPSILHRPPSSTLPAVFPRVTVRPLVLRGHDLHLGTTPKGIATLRKQLVRFVLLALSLGRRAVVPLVRCDIPTAETPVHMRNHVVLLKLTDRTMCDGDARAPGWTLPHSVRPEESHERLTLTAEMTAMGDYSKVMQWPPPHAESCCQVIPDLRCVDKYGDRGELHEEVMLCERDFSWLIEEEKEQHEDEEGGGAAPHLSKRVIGGHARLTLDALGAASDARTLILDLGERGPDSRIRDETAGDPLAMLPPADQVEAAVRERMRRTPHLMPPRSRKCVEQLLAISAG